jgi:hypothetical protein
LEIEYRTDSADNSQSEVWTFEITHGFFLTRLLTQRIGKRRRQHIIRLGIEGDDYRGEYLQHDYSLARAFLQADWQAQLLKFQNQPHEVIIGFATYDVELDAFGEEVLIPSTQSSRLLHFVTSLGLDFITEDSGRSTWFEVPEENVPYMLFKLDIGVKRVEDLGSVLEFRKYDRFQILADFCKSQGKVKITAICDAHCPRGSILTRLEYQGLPKVKCLKCKVEVRCKRSARASRRRILKSFA